MHRTGDRLIPDKAAVHTAFPRAFDCVEDPQWKGSTMESLREAIEIANRTTHANVDRVCQAVELSRAGGDLPALVESWFQDHFLYPALLGLQSWHRYWDAMNAVSPFFTASAAAAADPRFGPIESASAWHWAAFLAADELMRIFMRASGCPEDVHWFLGEYGAEQRTEQWPLFRERQPAIRLQICEQFANVGNERKRLSSMLIRERDSALIESEKRDQAGRKVPAVPPTVSTDPPQIDVNGKAYALSPNQAIYLKELVRCRDWMSDSEFRAACPEVGDTARPDLWRKKLPADVLVHLETQRNRGTRWQ